MSCYLFTALCDNTSLFHLWRHLCTFETFFGNEPCLRIHSTLFSFFGQRSPTFTAKTQCAGTSRDFSCSPVPSKEARHTGIDRKPKRKVTSPPHRRPSDYIYLGPRFLDFVPLAPAPLPFKLVQRRCVDVSVNLSKSSQTFPGALDRWARKAPRHYREL